MRTTQVKEADARETTWQITVRVFREWANGEGLSPDLAQAKAERNALTLFRAYGRGARYICGIDSVAAPSINARDEAIRHAHRHGAPVVVVLRTFRIGRRQYYNILNGNRGGRKGKAGEAA